MSGYVEWPAAAADEEPTALEVLPHDFVERRVTSQKHYSTHKLTWSAALRFMMTTANEQELHRNNAIAFVGLRSNYSPFTTH